MKLFDYLYYRVYFAYLKKNESLPWLYATNLVALMQTLNILLFYYLFEMIFNINFNIKIVIIVLILFLIGVNYFRFQKIKPYNKLSEVWNSESKKSRTKNGVLIVLYIVVTIASPIIFGIFFHN